MRRSILAAVVLAATLGAACDVGTSPPMKEVARSERCSTCHMQDYENAKNHVGKRPPTCEICHTQKRWHEKHFEHPFELTGKHETTDCFDCHTGAHPKFEGTSRECLSCHESEFEKQNEKKPFHRDNGTQCDKCHLTSGWADWTPKKEPPPIPPPLPTAAPTETPTALPTATATATATAPLPHPIPHPPRPWPTPTPTQHPTAIPTVVPTVTPTVIPTTPPIVTHPSERE